MHCNALHSPRVGILYLNIVKKVSIFFFKKGVLKGGHNIFLCADAREFCPPPPTQMLSYAPVYSRSGFSGLSAKPMGGGDAMSLRFAINKPPSFSTFFFKSWSLFIMTNFNNFFD